MEPIEGLVQRWLELDRDEGSRREIEDLVRAKDIVQLEDRLRHRITFGTAGLRSSMRAGFAHMNSVTVIQASQGLAQYIIEDNKLSGKSKEVPAIVIGFDARYNSEKFARLTAAAFLAKGLSVLWLGQHTHTPLVPWTIKRFGAAAGVMVTASHNPKNDNGYKVYWSNGSQIIPPHDTGIAKAIDREQSILTWDTTLVEHDARVRNVLSEATKSYLEAIRGLIRESSRSTQGLAFAYTPLHGVGLPYMKAAAQMLGTEGNMRIVNAQAAPDPEFPTVPFPNPEEKGALDLAKQEAEKDRCNLVISNDPDADRFAVAELLSNGKWQQLTGNQMGVLLAVYLLETWTGPREKLAMLASTVSSRMLAVIAKEEGFHFKETLTGFKWLGNVAQQLEQQGYDAIYAYEEAIGYMFRSVVWDKDGIAAATVFLQACMQWKKDGLTPWQKLEQLYEKYGYFEDANTYLISPSPSVTNKVFDDIRRLNSGSRPTALGNREILRWRDLTLGYDSSTPDNKPDLPVDASAQMITCELEEVVFTARGSGTEPKIKLYIEARGETAIEARNTADAVLNDLLKEWFKPEYGLKLAGTQ